MSHQHQDTGTAIGATLTLTALFAEIATNSVTWITPICAVGGLLFTMWINIPRALESWRVLFPRAKPDENTGPGR